MWGTTKKRIKKIKLIEQSDYNGEMIKVLKKLIENKNQI